MVELEHEQADAQFLEYVVKSLVDNPEKVQVERSVDEMGVLITLSVDPEDMGKVIGRNGNTAKSIRSLLRTVGMKHDSRVNLKINEPEGGMRDTSNEAGNQSSDDVDQAMDDLNV